MKEGVSVVVCSYNGAKRLPQTLRHLAKQQVPPGIQWELIVVDNNSTDNTSEIALSEWGQYQLPTPLVLLKQPLPGVSYAREKGLAASQYNYIIQCDDDNWLAPDYIEKVVTILNNDKKIAIVGGQSTGSFEIEPPQWFKNFSTAYAIGQRRKTSMPIDWLATAGVGIRKKALEELKKVKFEHILSGRQGKALLAGDDLELCAAFRAIGYEVYYSTELNFVHYMPANRLTWPYLKKMVLGQARAQSVFDMYSIVHAIIAEGGTPDFQQVYKKLSGQITAPIKKKTRGLRKTARFIKSLFSDREGDSNSFTNKYYFNYFKYIATNKRELKERYYKIESFYKRVNNLAPL